MKSDQQTSHLPDEVTVREFRRSDREWVQRAHVRHYTQVEKFDASFEQAVAAALDAFIADAEAPVNRGFILERNGQASGCVFCVEDRPGTARLKLFYLESDLRGCGLGRALLHRVFEHTKAQGYRHLLVSTYSAHQAACALYAKTGFTCISEKPVVAYGRELTEQTWLAALDAATGG